MYLFVDPGVVNPDLTTCIRATRTDPLPYLYLRLHYVPGTGREHFSIASSAAANKKPIKIAGGKTQ